MKYIVKSLLAAVFFLLGGGVATGATGPGERIQINEADGRYSFSVPASQLVMTMPKSGWLLKDNNIGGGTSNPRYFYFENKADSSVLSGWFEPDRLFTSVRQLWEEESERQRKGGMPPTVNVAYETLEGWDTVMYDYVIGEATSSHIRGHWVQSGTWIDIHVSTTTKKSAAENRKKLKALLKDISVTTKSSPPDSSVSAAGERTVREFQLPNMGHLELSLPRSWKDQLRQPPQELPPTITLSPSTGNAFQVLITPFWSVRPNVVVPGKEEMRKSVMRTIEEARTQAVEQVIPLKELTGKAGAGYYFSATDKSPKPGEFKYMTQGMLRVGDLALLFTALTNDSAEPALAETIEMLKDAKYVARRVP